MARHQLCIIIIIIIITGQSQVSALESICINYNDFNDEIGSRFKPQTVIFHLDDSECGEEKQKKN